MQRRVDPAKLSGAEVASARGGAQQKPDLEQFLSAMRRQVRVVVAMAAGFVLLALLYIAIATPQFTATTELLIDSQKDKTELPANVAELTFDTSAIDSQVEILKSEKIALSVIASLRLTDDPEFSDADNSIVGSLFRRLHDALEFPGWFASQEKSEADAQFASRRAAITKLKDNLDVHRISRTYVLAVRYTSTDRDKAASIANAVADGYLSEQLDAKFEATRRTAGWLQTRLVELNRHSTESDLAIEKFKAEHDIVVTGGEKPGLISDQQLTELNTQMIVAQGDTARAEARYVQIEELLKTARSGIAVPDSLANPVVNDIRSKYLAASKMEAQLEGKLGAGHFQVIALKGEMEEYDRLIYEELGRISESYKSDASVARAKEHSLSQSLAALVGQNAATNETLVQLRGLEREAETYRSLSQSYGQRYQEALQQQSVPISEARIITTASAPLKPSSPKRGLIVAFALVFGAIAGAGVGSLREYGDRVFRIGADVRDELGLELLGMLPAVERVASDTVTPGGAHEPRNVRQLSAMLSYTIDHPLSSFSEAFRSAKVAVDLALGEQRGKIIGVISALPHEGKSTVSKNFASLLAHLGARTLLVDADLRDPSLTRAMGSHAVAGLLEAVRGEWEIKDLSLVEPESGLAFLPVVIKKRITHSSEILCSPAMRNLLTNAGEAFDYIVVDLPPLAPVVDVRAAASLFDAFLLVVEWGRTPRGIVQTLLVHEEKIWEKCLGVVYNKVDLKRLRLYESYASREYYDGRRNQYHRQSNS